MTTGQVRVGVVADPGTIGQQKGIGGGEAVESLAAENRMPFTDDDIP